ncbi:MAG: PD40 domain-containing protein [Planctomycetes bacterium]|nr:PD40 domain-containing protein [Planctomycetota bacterium]
MNATKARSFSNLAIRRPDTSKIKRCLLTVALLMATAHSCFGQATTLATIGADGSASDGNSARASLSSDGRYVAFQSAATNLVADDTNAASDVFVYDRMTGTTMRVSVTSSGEQADANSGRPAISDDGRYVAFFSDAANLAPGDTETFDVVICPTCTGRRDVFIHDRDPDENGTFDEGNNVTIRVSESSGGVAGNGDSTRPSIAGDGLKIAFRSDATNLVSSDSNGVIDVFVHDQEANTTIRASVSAAGVQGNAKSDRPAISGNGRFVAFYSDASNLIEGDTNVLRDVFVRDLDTDSTVRISVGAGGSQSDGASSRPVLSSDGRFVAFRSAASNLVAGDTNFLNDVFIHDRDPDENGVFDEGNGIVQLVSAGIDGPGDGASSSPAMSADGILLAFHSDATNLVATDQNLASDVFLLDRLSGILTRISVCGARTEGDGLSERASVSDDGRFVAYQSKAENLVSNDSNTKDDIFVRDLEQVGDDSGCVIIPEPDTTPPTTTPPSTTRSGCGAFGMLNFAFQFTTLVALRLRHRR